MYQNNYRFGDKNIQNENEKSVCIYYSFTAPKVCSCKTKGPPPQKEEKTSTSKFTVLVISVAEWLAGWTTKSAIWGSPAVAEIAISNSVLGNYLIGQCC